MIQRRVLLAAVAFAAAVGCKGSSSAPAPKPDPSQTKPATPTPPPTPATDPALTGSGSAIDPPPAPGGAITRPFFYKVEKDGKTSYLMGTWHLGIDADKQLPKAVWDAFATTKAFAMEVDPADPAGLTAFKRTDGKTLEDELGPEYWAKLEALVPNPAMMKSMKPSAAVVLLQFKGMPQTTPMDLAFVTKAKDQKKQLNFLESVTLQVKLLDKWVDVRMLKQTIDDYDGTKRMLDDALAAYMAGDDAALVSLLLDRPAMKKAGFTDAELDQALQEMIYDRNAAWVPKLDALFTAGDAFVAVGAGHLIGPNSVVELLTAKGFTITRVGP